MTARKCLSWLSMLTVLSMALSACVPAAPTQAPTAEPTKVEAAAAQPAAPKSEKVTLTVAHFWSDADTKGPVISKILKDFQAANPDIDLKVQLDPIADHNTIFETAFMAGQEADIKFGGNDKWEYWLDNGMIVPVNDYVQAWLPDTKWYPEALATATIKGKTAAFPLEGFTWPMWYNTNVLKDSGVEKIPQTVDELIDACNKVNAKGYTCFDTAGAEWPGQTVIKSMIHAALGTEKAEKLFAVGNWSQNAEVKSVLETIAKMRDAGVFEKNVEGVTASAMNEMFYTDKVAMMHAGSWAYGELPKEMADHVVLGGFPKFAGSPYEKPVAIVGQGVGGMMITRNGAKKLDVVKRFMTFFYKPENVALFVEDTGMNPPFAVKVNESKLQPLFQQALKLGENNTVLNFAKVPSKIDGPLSTALKDLYLPGKSVDEILKAVDQVYAENK